jgi:hypothetical protein
MYTLSLSLLYKSGVPDTLFYPHPINRTAMIMVGMHVNIQACREEMHMFMDAEINVIHHVKWSFKMSNLMKLEMNNYCYRVKYKI